MIYRIIKWLKGSASSELTCPQPDANGLVWRRFRNGWTSGSYIILPILGGGVLAYHQGVFLNDGRMLPNVPTAKAFCEAHSADCVGLAAE